MRNINSAALARIQAQYGIESVILLQINWPTGSVYYGEKERPDYGVEGRILQTGGIDDVVGVGQSGSSRSVSFTLSDHDGALKNYFDNVDLHKMPCKILQWFEGLPLSEAFVIFDGQINTPIEWNEGDRTLSITVMSLLENREFGFSPDESYFHILSSGVLGSAFPIVFGTNVHMPVLQITEAPQIMLAEGFSIVNDFLWNRELTDLALQAQAAYDSARLAYAAGLSESFIAATYINGSQHSYIGLGGIEIWDDPPDDYNSYLQHHNQSNQYYAQYTQYSNQYLEILNQLSNKRAEYAIQKKYAKKQVRILSTNAPRGVPLEIQIGEHFWNVVIEGTTMTILNQYFPPRVDKAALTNYTQAEIYRAWQGEKIIDKFVWVPGGSKVTVLNQPMKYVISLGQVNVVNVFGKQQGMYVPIPKKYYTIAYTPFKRRDGSIVYATTLTTTLPLTSIQDLAGKQIWEDDNIYVDVVGATPGRYIDILEYCISTFTNLHIDFTSFAACRLYTDAIPMNHVVRDRQDALQYMEALAFQAKCALWINDNTVFTRYMPVEPTPVDTIGLGDILEDSLTIFSTETEDVVTKFVAKWKFTQSQPEDNIIVFRYNMQKYLYHEEEYNYFAFNDPGSVSWSGRYWSVRKGTVYKKIRFRTDLTKLNLEAFDAVTIDLVGLVSCTAVTGIVESAVYNSDNKEIDFVVWLPIRLGEMCQHPFAYPASEVVLYGNPADPGIYTGNPYEKLLDTLNFMDGTYNYYVPYALSALAPLQPEPYYIEENTSREISVDTALFNGEMSLEDPLDLSLDSANDYNKFDVTPFTPTTTMDSQEGKSFFGTIVGPTEGSNSNYRVQLFNSTTIVTAKQALIGADSPAIPAGMPVTLVKLAGQYYFQAPIWAKTT